MWMMVHTLDNKKKLQRGNESKSDRVTGKHLADVSGEACSGGRRQPGLESGLEFSF